MPKMIWLTNIDTAEPVGLPVDKIVLIEQKRAQDGGAVAIYLAHDKEIYVSESLTHVSDLLGDVAGMRAPTVARLRPTGTDT